jgi:hypothetical protein
MAAYMRDFSRDPRQNTFADQDYEKGFFSDEGFVSYLFSRHNRVLIVPKMVKLKRKDN